MGGDPFERQSLRNHQHLTRNRIDTVSTVILNGAFFFAGLMLLLGVFLQPPSMEGTLKDIVVYIWAALLVVSGPLSIIGRVRDRFRVEATGAAGASVAFGIYALAVAVSGSYQTAIATLFFGSFAVSFGYRAFKLNRFAREVDSLDRSV